MCLLFVFAFYLVEQTLYCRVFIIVPHLRSYIFVRLMQVKDKCAVARWCLYRCHIVVAEHSFQEYVVACRNRYLCVFKVHKYCFVEYFSVEYVTRTGERHFRPAFAVCSRVLSEHIFRARKIPPPTDFFDDITAFQLAEDEAPAS